MQPVHKKIGIIILLLIVGIALGVYVYAAAQQATNAETLQRGLLYLNNSPGSVWNATDVGAIYLLRNEFPNTFGNVANRINQKKIFEFDIYPFTGSMLNGPILPPSAFEIGLGTPQLFYRIGRCEPFTLPELENLGGSTNDTINPYRASHAVFFLNLIQRNYGTLCLDPGTATRARTQMLRAVTGLTLTNQNPERFDAWLEQECARSIALGIPPSSSTLDFVSSKQDMNILESRTYGGWWQYQTSVNGHVGDYDGEGNYLGELYWEVPNGHTTAFALCLIAKGAGAT